MPTRREILGVLGAVPAADVLTTGRVYAQAAAEFPRRLLGRTGRMVVPLALGGQGSVQWPKPGIDPADIVVRAVQAGINYLDTANDYGPSQANYGEAFRRLHLAPGQPGYNATLRRSLFLASKTGRRYGRNPELTGPTAIDDLKRILTQIFGDGQGFIPEGAYLDSIQIHDLMRIEQVDQVFEGYGERGGVNAERIGAIAALLDYRDGTNYTGLNPEHRHYVRHLGITGHKSSAVLMHALRRDTENQIDTVLMALNANDNACSSHQNNALALAVAKGIGVIAMKVFADGAFYGKEARFSRNSDDVILSVGRPGGVPYKDLVRYSLSLPGVSCAVIGIGMVNRDRPEEDQIMANLTAALSDMPSALERKSIENAALTMHGAGTNYFQETSSGIVQPTNVRTRHDGDRIIVEWDTAFAGPEPLRWYHIMADNRSVLKIPFRPQLTDAPLSAMVPASEVGDATLSVRAEAEAES